MNFYLKLAIIIVSVVIIIALGVIFTVILHKKKKHKKNDSFPDLLYALGGKENITEVTQKGSRVSVIVKDKKIVDKEKVKEQGVETIVVSNKKFTMLIDSKQSALVFNYLMNEINM